MTQTFEEFFDECNKLVDSDRQRLKIWNHVDKYVEYWREGFSPLGALLSEGLVKGFIK